MTTQVFEITTEKWKHFWEAYPNEFAQLQVLEAKIGYRFKNRDLLFEALTHRSAISYAGLNCEEEIPWNERMEFLGDSVLGLIVSSWIWSRKALDEGQLSQLKASLVSESSLAKLAQDLGLPHCLTVGKVERKTGSHQRPSLLADALEALIGAIYLDSSYATVAGLVQTWLTEFFSIDSDDVQDSKTRLQELFQGRFQEVPQYVTLEERGPDHSKTFRVAVVFHGKTLAEAEGTSKKRASQEAAKLALSTWEDLDPNGIIEKVEL